jgi:hypothetical protein
MQSVHSKMAMVSLALRGNNGYVVNQVQFANGCIYKSSIYNTVLNTQALVPTLRQLQQVHGGHVYIIGAISSTTCPVTGNKISWPIKRHVYNRGWFGACANVLTQSCIYNVNPASKAVFGRNIKATYIQQRLSCANMAHSVMQGKRGKGMFANLHRGNKRAVRGACAIVMVQPKVSLLSGGVQQELAHMLKHNPNCPVFVV